ncbi:Gfo/Idh/MocA family protein [Novosphingobium sp.]|uniref:Gfo/Idh/MocA family protein n=1 Tax=Novosphingobium sp. TaxID=1874826 RepID=UPI003D112AF7
MSIEAVRVGVIGAGDISTVYLNAISRSPAVDLRMIATRNPATAQETATGHGAKGGSVADLLADDAIELVVNLTPGIAHDALNAAIIDAGKHVYSEKPFALSRRSAQDLALQAQRRNVLIGSAPDTFYGSAHQAARRALDSGAIGAPVFGMSFLGLPGLEHFHPNPAAFYRAGGEPPFDMGPYYIAMWIHLLGPVKRVYSASGSGQTERTIRRGPLAGTQFPVSVDTTFNTILEFDTASVSLVVSLDVVTPTQRPGELYGAGGTLALADPMFFGGEPKLTQAGSAPQPLETADLAFSKANRLDHTGRPVSDYRGAGLTDLALAIRTGSHHRTAPDFVIHAVEVMETIVQSARSGTAIDCVTRCERPALLDPVADAQLIAMTASPFELASYAAHERHGQSPLLGTAG